MIADVAVPVEGIDAALTYAVPRALESRVSPGVRVLVPVVGRRVVGLVVDVRADTARPAAMKLKPVHEVLDDAAIVDAHQLALAKFVAQYYAADIGSCARLVMPPDTERVVERRFQLSERGEQARVLSNDLTRADLALLAEFAPAERKRERALVRTAAQRARLERLVALGLIERVADERAAGAVRHDERVVVIDGGKPLPKSAPALAAFDAWLRATGGSADLVEAAAAHANPRGKARALVALGRARIERTVALGSTRASGSGALGVAGVDGGGDVARAGRVLTTAQDSALARIVGAVDAHASEAFLLEGVTGSGKTEVYLRAVRAALAHGRGSILIVPEIGLTPQLVGRVRSALADAHKDVVVLHSRISAAERRDAHARLREGSARVAVGARSALFAPIKDLGLVVVDEEHDQSLKQDETPRYHARDVALWRAKHEGAVCVLGSATPSLESRHNAALGKLTLLELPVRVGGGGALPAVEIVDLRARGGMAESKKRDRLNADEGPGVVLSAPLAEAVGLALAANEQTLLFLNKRGYSSAVLCEMCGHIETCPNCSVTLVLHRKKNVLRCHQCDHEHLVPTLCPDCGNDGLVAIGLGTERLESEVRARFPDARVARLDRDSTEKKGALESVLAAVHTRTVDIVVGTQMIAKGHDFPGVTLVGVVLADIALAMPDFRAQERAFALLAQVAGRAGRGATRGRVLIQTYKPESAAVQFAVTHDVRGFAVQELAERELHKYPPFSRAALLRIEHEDASICAALAGDAHSIVVAAGAKLPKAAWSALGPAPCVLERLHNRTRWQVFIRARTAAQRASLVDAVRTHAEFRRDVARHRARFVVDIDPVHML